MKQLFETARLSGRSLIAAAAVGSVLMGGCEASPSPHPDTINLDVTFPDVMPTAARELADATVWLQSTSIQPGNGSAVKIQADTYVTAQHVLTAGKKADGSDFIRPLPQVCGTIKSPFANNRVFGIAKGATSGETYQADERAIVTLDKNANADQPAVQPIGTSDWKPGDKIYFANYQQETINGAETYRIPNPSDEKIAGTPRDTTKMAQYGGIALKYVTRTDGRPYWVVATGIGVDYGQGLPGDAARPGASGGGAATDKGFGGIAVRYIPNVTERQAEQQTGVSIDYEGDVLTLAHVEPVTMDDVAELRKQTVELQPDC